MCSSTVLSAASKSNPNEAVPCCSTTVLKNASDAVPSSNQTPAGECSNTEKKAIASDDGEEQLPQSDQLDMDSHGHEVHHHKYLYTLGVQGYYILISAHRSQCI